MRSKHSFLRLVLLLIGSILLIITILIYMLFSIYRADNNIVSIYKDRVIPLKLLNQLSYTYSNKVIGTLKKATDGDLCSDSTLHILRYSQAENNKNWNEYLITYLTPEEEKLVKKTKIQKDSADKLIQQIIEDIELSAGKDLTISKAQYSKLNISIDSLTKSTNELINIQTIEADSLTGITESVFIKIFILIIFITVLCLVVLSLYFKKYRLEKIIVEQAEKLAIKNEELITTNEELQTTIEELDTTNEELSTTNEEFYTTNEELEALNGQLHQSNNELELYKNHLEKLVAERLEELKESELKYSNVVNNAPIGIYQRHLDGKYANSNKAHAYQFECQTVEELLNVYPNVSNLWDEPEQLHLFTEKLTQNKEIQNFETKIKLKNGKVKYFSISALFDEKKGLINGFSVDITERKSYELAFAETQSKLNAVFESTKDLIWAVGAEQFEIIAFNKAFYNYYLTKNIVLENGKPINEVLPPEFVPQWQNYYKRVLQEGAYETEYVTIDGKLILNLSFYPLVRNNTVFGISVFARDITELKNANEKLRVLKRSIDLSPDAAYWMNEDGEFLYVNETGYKMLGYSEDEIMKMKIFDINVLANETSWSQLWQKVKENKSVTKESIQRHKDGREIPIELTTTYIEYEGKEYNHGFAKDITERKKAEEKIKTSESKYRRLHQSMTDGFASVDMNGNIIEFNEAYRLILGYDTQEVYKLTYKEITPEKWHSLENEIITNQVFANGYSDIYEKEYIRKDGTIIPVELRTYLLKNDENENVGMWAIIRDITERKKTEDALKSSEQKFSTAFNCGPSAISITDVQNGTFVDCNESLLNLLGYTRAELIGGSSIELGIWIDLEERKQLIERLKKDGIIKNAEINFRTKSGKLVNTLFSCSCITYDGKNYLLSLLEDITKRKETDKALKESEERFRVTFENAGIGIAIVDNAGKPIKCNKALENMLGYSNNELTSMVFSQFTHPDDIAIDWDLYTELIEEKRDLYSIEKRYIAKDGSIIWGMLTVSLFKPNDNTVSYGIGMVENITERKQAEIALKASEERLQYLLDSVTDYIYSVKIENEQVVETLHGEGCKTVTGYSSSDFNYNNELWINIVPQEDRHLILKQALNIIKNSIAEPVEHRITHKNGQILWIRNSPVLKYNKEGLLVGYEGLITNITERKIVEQALIASEELFRQVTTLSGYLVFDYNIEENKIQWNGDVFAVTGFTNKEFETANFDTWVSMLHPEDKENTLNIFSNSLKNDIPYHAEYRFILKSGNIIWIEANGFKISNNRNSNYRIIGIMKDITERKNREQAVLTGVIETEERERMHFSQELHDGIGPIISAIKMYVQLLNMPESKMKSTEIVEKAGNLIDEASREVREISFKLSPHILQNYGIIEALNAYIDKIKETKDIVINLCCGNIGRFNDIIETIVYRVLCECVTNTIKHAKATKIDIEINFGVEMLEINYSDNGKGFDVESILNSRKGIGLLNMQSRIKSISGNMLIESKPENGMSVKIKVKTNNN